MIDRLSQLEIEESPGDKVSTSFEDSDQETWDFSEAVALREMAIFGSQPCQPFCHTGPNRRYSFRSERLDVLRMLGDQSSTCGLHRTLRNGRPSQYTSQCNRHSIWRPTRD